MAVRNDIPWASWKTSNLKLGESFFRIVTMASRSRFALGKKMAAPRGQSSVDTLSVCDVTHLRKLLVFMKLLLSV